MATVTQPKPGRKPQVKETQCFIGGKWVPAESGKTFDTINPATEEVIAKVAEGDAADVDLAVKAARKAFENGPWSKMDARDRGRLMNKLADLIEEEADELAALETLDNGKPIRDSRAADLPLTIDCLRYYAGWADKIHGQTIPVRGNYFMLHAARAGRRRRADHPLEFPDADGRLEMGPGLGRRLHDRDEAGRANAADLPADGAAGAEGRHSRRRDQRRPRLWARRPAARSSSIPGVDKIAFTGSTEAARSSCAKRAGTLKRITFELGGKSPNIVFADRRSRRRRRRRPLRPVLQSRPMLLCRQPVVCRGEGPRQVRREDLAAMNTKRKLGDPFDPATEQGPQVEQGPVRQDHELHRARARRKGPSASPAANAGGDSGYFIEPTLFAGVKDDMAIADEEIFGPVMSVLEVQGRRRNRRSARTTRTTAWPPPCGRATSRKAHRLAAKIRAGTVWINCYDVFDAAAPFGGFKQSGIGRELGERGLDAYTEWKTVTVSLD